MRKSLTANAPQLQAIEEALGGMSSGIQGLGAALAACDRAQTPVQKLQCMGGTLEKGLIPGIQQVTSYVGNVYYTLGMDSITGYQAQACPTAAQSAAAHPTGPGVTIPSASAHRLDEHLRTNMNAALHEFQSVVDVIQTCSQQHGGDSELEAGQRLVCYHNKGLFQPLARGLAGMLQNVQGGLSALVAAASAPPAPPAPSGSETHTCADGTTFACAGGTLGCTDNSPTHCAKSAPTGGAETHTCADGTTFACAGGTPGCTDDSPTHCTKSASVPP